jgi:hypothetical protein
MLLPSPSSRRCSDESASSHALTKRRTAAHTSVTMVKAAGVRAGEKNPTMGESIRRLHSPGLLP